MCPAGLSSADRADMLAGAKLCWLDGATHGKCLWCSFADNFILFPALRPRMWLKHAILIARNGGNVTVIVGGVWSKH